MRTMIFDRSTVILTLVFMCCVGQADAQPRAQDHAMFKNLFEDRIAQVRRTRDKADDIALLKEMQQAVEKIPDSPEVQRLIYQGIIDLGVYASQYAPVVAAADALTQHFPEDPSADPQYLISLLDKGYRSSPRSEKKAVGELLLTRLYAEAQATADDGRFDEAVKTYRRARLIASDIGSTRLASIQSNIDIVERAMRIEGRIQSLTQTLKDNPTNATAARELTLIYMIAKAQPPSAAQVVQATGDSALIEVVNHAASPLQSLEPQQALTVADWYLAQRDANEFGLAGEYPRKVLGLAVEFYDHTLANYAARDARYLRITQSRKQASDQLEELVKKGDGVEALSKWIDLIDRFDAKSHGLGQRVVKVDGVLASDATDFILNVTPKAGYDLKLKFTFLDGDDGLNFCLPYEGQYLMILYSRYVHTRTELMGVKENMDVKHMLSPGKKVDMLIQVRPIKDGSLGVQLTVNNVILIQWQGKASELTNNPEVLTPDKFKGSIRVTCGGRIRFDAIEFKDLGEN